MASDLCDHIIGAYDVYDYQEEWKLSDIIEYLKRRAEGFDEDKLCKIEAFSYTFDKHGKVIPITPERYAPKQQIRVSSLK